MYFTTKSLLFLAAAVFTVAAQSTVTGTAGSATGTASAPAPSSTSGLDACVIQCSMQAAANSSSGCSSFADLPCVCTSLPFQQAALSCLQANCTAAEVSAANQLQAQECAAFVGSSSGSSGTSGTLTSATSGTSSGTLTGTGQSTTSTGTLTSTGSTTESSSATTSAASTSSSSNAATSKASFGYGGLFGSAVALVGAIAGVFVVI